MESEFGSVPSALYFVLKYLPLYELLVMSQVCRSLRDVVNHDTLLWINMIINKPLDRRVSDNILRQMASRAHGRLRGVALLNCHNLTDDGLQRIVETNPLLEKLYLPGCTGLTPEGIIRSVKSLTQRNNRLKSLKISGIYHLNKDHIAALESCLGVATKTQQLMPQNQPLHYYHNYKKTSQSSGLLDDDHQPIDVEICPTCNEVRMVFDCPREMCRAKGERSTQSGCRGCCHCIPRCEECGVCIDNEEEEEGGETLCAENLCLNCWLQLPKCSFCNRPYCRRHADEYFRRNPPLDAAGFVCEVCSESYSDNETI